MLKLRQWLLLAALWIATFLLLGATISTIGVFFNPLIHDFGWSHEQVSRLATAYLLCMGLFAPVVGLMLDRVPAQFPMAAGAVASAAGYLLASRANSLAALVVAFALIGAGAGASTLVPVTIVAANWFPKRRGLTIGICVSGSSLAATLMPPVIAHVIIVHGWRSAMLTLGVPNFAIAIPVILAIVRTRPPGAAAISVREEVATLPGLEIGPALHAAPFWMLAGVQVCFTVAFNGVYYHLVPFLIFTGYSPQRAAIIFGAKSVFVTAGTILLGGWADRVGARKVLAVAMLALSLSLIDLLASGNPTIGLLAVGLFMVGYGSPTGATSTTIPMLITECLGIRRFASLMGIMGLIATVASALGPIVTGRIFDMTGSYVIPFGLCAALFAGAGLIATMVYAVPGHDQIPLAQAAPAPAVALEAPRA